MGLIDSIIGAGKFLLGMGLGFILILSGLMVMGFSGGDTLSMLLGFVILVVGSGFILWSENSRRSALIR